MLSYPSMMPRGWGGIALATLASCWTESRVDDRFSSAEWEFLQTFRRPAMDPCPPGLSGDRCGLAAGFGQALFFDRSYSGPIDIGDDGVNGGLGAHGEAG